VATDVSNQNGTSVSQLVSGILDDAQRLFQQHARLLQADIRKDIREASEAGLSVGMGGLLLGVGALMLLITLALFITWAAGPENMPYWASFGIVGALCAIAGGIVFYRGREMMNKVNPMPEESAQAVKEDLQWKTNPK